MNDLDTIEIYQQEQLKNWRKLSKYERFNLRNCVKGIQDRVKTTAFSRKYEELCEITASPEKIFKIHADGPNNEIIKEMDINLFAVLFEFSAAGKLIPLKKRFAKQAVENIQSIIEGQAKRVSTSAKKALSSDSFNSAQNGSKKGIPDYELQRNQQKLEMIDRAKKLKTRVEEYQKKYWLKVRSLNEIARRAGSDTRLKSGSIANIIQADSLQSNFSFTLKDIEQVEEFFESDFFNKWKEERAKLISRFQNIKKILETYKKNGLTREVISSIAKTINIEISTSQLARMLIRTGFPETKDPEKIVKDLEETLESKAFDKWKSEKAAGMAA